MTEYVVDIRFDGDPERPVMIYFNDETKLFRVRSIGYASSEMTITGIGDNRERPAYSTVFMHTDDILIDNSQNSTVPNMPLTDQEINDPDIEYMEEPIRKVTR